MPDVSIKRARAVFDAVVDLPPQARRLVLDSHCESDNDLRSVVEDLLACHDRGLAEFLDPAAVRDWSGEASLEPARLPRRIGSYEVLRILGEGGMGVVYEARQEHPSRIVALKVIRPERASQALLARFRHEAELLGRLQHPGIAHIYEASTAEMELDSGARVDIPFFAMELIRGQPLLAYVRQRRPSVQRRLELFARICEAVAYAHGKGVIHRDLKPGNILVVHATGQPDRAEGADPGASTRRPPQTEEGQPRILDFGVARAVGPEAHTVTLATTPGQLIGTIAYMSPEQLTGETSQLDHRADVYALGVILFELLTDRLPHEVAHRTLPQVVREVCEQEAPRLSSMDRAFRGDLDVIAATCLAKDRARRYTSAHELADDIRRYLRQEPIRARSAGAAYRLKRFVQRNKIVVSAAVLLFATMATATVVSLDYAIEADHSADESAWRAYQAQLAAAQAALEMHDVRTAAEHLSAVSAEFRDTWEWRHLSSQLDLSRSTLTLPRKPSARACLSPDATRMAIDVLGPGFQVWDLARRELLSQDRKLPGRVTSFTFDPAGSRLAVGLYGHNTRIYDTGTGQTLLELADISKEPRAMAFSPDGLRLACACRDAQLHIYDARSGAATASLSGHSKSIACVAFSPDGRLLVSGDDAGFVRVWDGTTGALSEELSFAFPVWLVALSDHSDRLAVALYDYSLHVFSLSDFQRIAVLRGHTDLIASVRFSEDDSMLVTASTDNTIRTWDIDDNRQRAVLRGHRDLIRVASPAAGDQIVSISEDGTVKWWPADPIASAFMLSGHQQSVSDVAFSPDGAVLASSASDMTVRFWDAATGAPIATLQQPVRVVELAWSPDGGAVALGWLNGAIHVIDTLTGRDVATLSEHQTALYALCYSPVDPLLAGVASDGRLVVWNTATWEVVARFDVTRTPHALAFSPDGRRLAAGDGRGVTWIWDTHTWEALTSLKATGEIKGLAFSAGSDQLAIRQSGTIRIVELDNGEVQHQIETSSRGRDMLQTSDARRLIYDADGDLHLLDARTLERVAVLRIHDDQPGGLSISPDGHRLAAGMRFASIRIWDVEGVEERLRNLDRRRESQSLLEPQIDGWLERFGDFPAVLDHIQEQHGWDQDLHRVARQCLLRSALEHRADQIAASPTP